VNSAADEARRQTGVACRSAESSSILERRATCRGQDHLVVVSELTAEVSAERIARALSLFRGPRKKSCGRLIVRTGSITSAHHAKRVVRTEPIVRRE
jgi:hypothetical protein